MNDIIKKVIREALKAQEVDFHTRQTHRQMNLEDVITVTNDWGEKRVESLLREAERIGIVFESAHDGGIVASFKGIELKGTLRYEHRGWGHRTTKWTRPRMALRLWVYNNKNEQMDAVTGDKRWRGSFGGEALSIVFGKERMMTYNRLMQAMMQTMGQ